MSCCLCVPQGLGAGTQEIWLVWRGSTCVLRRCEDILEDLQSMSFPLHGLSINKCLTNTEMERGGKELRGFCSPQLPEGWGCTL